MTDGHIHIERGPYTLDWIRRFTGRAAETGLSEIGLLEHSFRFEEFVPMYDSVRAGSEFVSTWFSRQKRCRLGDYLELIGKARNEDFPVRVRFGLEVCYFREHADRIAELARDRGFDFLLGSIHYVDGFAFDLGAEYWDGMDADRLFRRYFEDSVSLAESGLFDGIGHPDHIGLYAVNTVANYSPDIIPLLQSPYGSAFTRAEEFGYLVRVDSVEKDSYEKSR